MQDASGLGVDAQLGERGSNAPCRSLSSGADQYLIAAILALVQQLAETNVHLLALMDQNAKTLEHIAFLTDLLAIDEGDRDEDAQRIYLDGTPIL